MAATVTIKPDDKRARARLVASRGRQQTRDLFVDAAAGASVALVAALVALAALTPGITVSFGVSRTNLLELLIVAPFLILAAATATGTLTLIFGLVASSLLGLAGRVMQIELAPWWYPTLAGGWAGAAVGAPVAASVGNPSQPDSVGSMAVWFTFVIIGQVGAMISVNRSIHRRRSLREAYAARPRGQFAVRQLLGLMTVAAVVAALVGAMEPRLVRALVQVVAAQALAIAIFAPWRRRRLA